MEVRYEWDIDVTVSGETATVQPVKDGKVFDPQGIATRAETASMMQRFCEALEK